MGDVEKLQSSVAALSRPEKVRILEWILREIGDSFPGIESDPAVAGGAPCIVRTRIPIWTLVRARQLGASEAEILRSYPSLRAQDLVQAWSYYDSHRDEIERQIRENEVA